MLELLNQLDGFSSHHDIKVLFVESCKTALLSGWKDHILSFKYLNPYCETN